MSRKEVPRAGLLKAALAGKISNAQGALAVHLSVRQFHRVKLRFAAEGPGGLLQGRTCPPLPVRKASLVDAADAEHPGQQRPRRGQWIQSK